MDIAGIEIGARRRMNIPYGASDYISFDKHAGISGM